MNAFTPKPLYFLSTGTVLFLLALLWAGCSSSTATENGTALLTPQEFIASLESEPQAQLIDCRTAPEAAAGMLDGAVLMDFRSADFAERLATLDKQKPVYVYCQVGGRSAAAVDMLEEMGFSKVLEMKGGYSAYLQSLP